VSRAEPALSGSAGERLDARAARIMRELHPPRARSRCESCAKPLGMILVEDCGLVMKLRGMIRRLLLDFLRLKPLCFFLRRTLFLCFYLTGVGVFCNHLVPTAD
jgi:hypothetical protein